MNVNTKWYHVWRGNLIDEVFETKVRAKKHAAWLHFTLGRPKTWMNRVSVTLAGEDIPFDDYEFKNGYSRKVFSTNEKSPSTGATGNDHE